MKAQKVTRTVCATSRRLPMNDDGVPPDELAPFRPATGRFRLSGFSFRLGQVEAGWVAAVVQSDRYWAQLQASYLSDAIANLLGAVGDLTGNATTARCSWFVEPGEYRWIFTRYDDQVHVRILGFRDGERPERDDAGTFVFETTVALRVLASDLVRSVESHPEARSDARYEHAWGHPLPRAQLEVLHRYLADSRA
jgi:hypothetical protein